MVSKTDILGRLKLASKSESHAELARFLGIAPATLSNWKARGSLDYDLVFSKCEQLNLDWLLTGRGAMFRDEQPTATAEPTIIYKSDPKDAAIIADKQLIIERDAELIASLRDKIRELEAKLSSKSVGLHSAPAVDTLSVGGNQPSRK